MIFEKNIFLNTNINDNIFISGDISSIKKLLTILLDNAIKYTDKHEKIYISLTSEKTKPTPHATRTII